MPDVATISAQTSSLSDEQSARTQPQYFHNGKVDRSRNVEWYQPELKVLPETARELFINYSNIPEDKILDHIYETRDKAWDVLPWPCIGVFRFLDFGAYTVPTYPEVVKRIQNGATFLDLGCCFGQDIRKMVYDGAPSDKMIGVDVENKFAELGYELFQDKDTLGAKFFTDDIFSDDFMAEWRGKIDIIYMGSFLHLFTFDKQQRIVRQLEKLLTQRRGSMVFGRNLGADQGGEFRMKKLGWNLFRHSEATIRNLWENQTDGHFKVDAQLSRYESEGWDNSRRGWQGDEIKQMTFTAVRV